MTDDSTSNSADSPETSKPATLPLSSWINIVSSFVFVVLGITFTLWPAFWQFGRDWVAKESIATVGYVILGIGVVLGFINAFLNYSRIKATYMASEVKRAHR